ncbi:MAG: hypothetical protein SV062_12275, partial [Thermodesulfobacteriota bacterium]|nr:hypothetical protein [Thermodesulfobacteriota bacterium]
RRIEETNNRIDSVREELSQRIDETNNRIDGINTRMDRLYEVIVRRDEHYKLEQKVANLELEVNKIKSQMAA